MSKIMNLPKLGVNMKDALIAEWYVKPGDIIETGDSIIAAETDKATQEIVATDSGIVGKLLCDVGDTVNVYEPIMVLLEEGETFSEAMLPVAGNAEKIEVDDEPEDTIISKVQEVETLPEQSIQRVRISPLAKKIAKEKSLDISKIKPDKPGKRIVKKDVMKAAERISEKSESGEERTSRIVPFSGMRKTIAARMVESQSTNAQTTHSVIVNMSEAVRLRDSLKAADTKVSYNDIISYTVCKALVEFPQVNAEYTQEGILLKDYVNLGIAVALDEGLIVPVVKDADLKSLTELSEAVKEVAVKAKEGTLSVGDYGNGSFTISNLGMFGLESFVAIINPPESGILAIGKIEKQAVVVNDDIKICPMMSMTLSYDHRVVDGAPAAQFLVRIKKLLENPYLML